MLKYRDEFLDYMKVERNYSLFTILSCCRDLDEFASFLDQEGIEFTTVDARTIRMYMTHLMTINNIRKTIARKLSSLKSFYKYLIRNDITNDNPLDTIDRQKIDKKLPEVLPIEQVIELFSITISNKAEINLRNKAIAETLYASGIRVSEMVNIKLEDLNLNNLTCKVKGKGNKERIVFINDFAKDSLCDYLEHGRLILLSKVNDPKPYVFINNSGNKLSSRGVEMIIKAMGRKLKQPKDIYPHMLRHSFATHLMDNGADIRNVQELLGHKSISATQIYTHVSKSHLKEVYQKSNPRAKKGQ